MLAFSHHLLQRTGKSLKRTLLVKNQDLKLASALALFLILTTTITGEQHGDYIEDIYRVLKILAYGTALLLVSFGAWTLRTDIPGSLKQFLHSYHPLFLASVFLYFLGQLIGALNGSAARSSLQQTASDGVVFVISFLY